MTRYETHYSHPLVSWGPTLIGAAVAIVTSVMFNFLGASFGVAAVAMVHTQRAAAAIGVAGVIWTVVANLIALAFGSWVAARATSNPDYHKGTLQGIAVWAVTSIAVVFVTSAALSNVPMYSDMSTNNTPPAITSQQGTDTPALNDGTTQVNPNAPTAKQVATVVSLASLGTFLAMALGLIAAMAGARAGARHPSWDNRPRVVYTDRV